MSALSDFAGAVPGDDAGSTAILQRFLNLHPRHIDLNLDRIERLLKALGSPERSLPPVFHVAGTNGKGSAVAFLKAILEADGRSVHCYTSPHLVRFHERIVLNGVPIGEDALCDILLACERANGGAPITYFEITTAAAFLAFAQTQADAVILEVGLGGRLDATNVVERPAASLIMPVDLDHKDYLGDTIEAIAGEKAGILKPGVGAVMGRQSDEARAVIEAEAQRVGAPLLIFGQDFMAHEERGRLVYEDAGGLLDLPPPRLPGRHQFDNAGAALAALRQQTALPVSVEALEQGLSHVFWPARLQRLTRGPLATRIAGPNRPEEGDLWLDGGHNPHAGAAIAQFMADLDERVPRPLFLICAFQANKDAGAFLAQFAGLARHILAIPLPSTSPGWQPADLCAGAERVGLAAAVAADPAQAMERILQITQEDGAGAPRVLICGSLHLAGEILKTHA